MPVRRIDLHPRRRLRNPERHIRALERWAEGFRGRPLPAVDADGLWFARMPVHEKAVTPRHAAPGHLARAAQAMIDAAGHLLAVAPEGPQVYAVLGWPRLFDSFVEVALRPNPFLFFNGPQGHGRVPMGAGWIESAEPATDLVHRLGLRLPEGFRRAGIAMTEFDPDWMEAPVTTETWALGRF